MVISAWFDSRQIKCVSTFHFFHRKNHMALTRVTITGADDATLIGNLIELSVKYPFVEWGILVGSRIGPRFPSFGWIKDLVDARTSIGGKMNLSLHICGKWLREIQRGLSNLSEVDALGVHINAFDRAQLNWHGEKQEDVVRSNVPLAFITYRPTIIFQLDGVNDELWRTTSKSIVCAGLFDASHGAGVTPAVWPHGRTDIQCGWSGGLGPDNLAESLPRIDEAAQHGGQDYWVDMETKVRTDDGNELDLDRVRECLAIAAKFMDEKAGMPIASAPSTNAVWGASHGNA